MAFMNTTLQDATDTAHSIQTTWMAGHLSRCDLVDRFIDNLLVDGVSIEHLLDRLHVLVTTTKNGLAVEKAADACQHCHFNYTAHSSSSYNMAKRKTLESEEEHEKRRRRLMSEGGSAAVAPTSLPASFLSLNND